MIRALVLGLLLFVLPTMATANPFTKRHCTVFPDQCLRVKTGDSWQNLFPDAHRRGVAMELSRQTAPLKAGQWVIVPPLEFDDEWYLSQTPLRRLDYPGYDKVLVFSPRAMAWGLYTQGKLIAWGAAAGGADTCSHLDGSCRTPAGIFRVIASYGVAGSLAQPIGCPSCEPTEYFTLFYLTTEGGQQIGIGFHPGKFAGIHPSHKCVRVSQSAAEYIHRQVPVGTPVIVLPYADD